MASMLLKYSKQYPDYFTFFDVVPPSNGNAYPTMWREEIVASLIVDNLNYFYLTFNKSQGDLHAVKLICNGNYVEPHMMSNKLILKLLSIVETLVELANENKVFANKIVLESDGSIDFG